MPSHASRLRQSPNTRILVFTPLLLLVLRTSLSADPLFSAPYLSFDVGYGPSSVAIADLNADGRPDLAAATAVTVSVLLGNGDGTFGARTEFATGSYWGPVAIADLNADGRPDLVTIVSVLLGNGDGTFGARIDFDTGSDPVSLAIADLNADGRPDLATVNESQTVSVLLGKGDGTFGAHSDFATGSGVSSVAIADLNADGRPDLVTANPGAHTVSVLLGNGDGTFGAHNDFGTLSYPVSVAIADLNADGRPDLATANANTVTVLLGIGDGTFGTYNDFGTGPGPSSVAIADLNADGRPDLVTVNHAARTVSVLLGNGDGTFGAHSDFGTGPDPVSVAIADLNADGRPDLATANQEANTVNVLLGNGDGTFGGHTYFGTGPNPHSLAIADLNADGRPDLATANGIIPVNPSGDHIGTVSVLLASGDGTFGGHNDFGTGYRPLSVAIADLNADGRPDLATANADKYRDHIGTVSVLLGNGDGTFGAHNDFGTGPSPSSVAIADLNADGRPDLATANNGASTVSVLLGNGDGTFGARTDFVTGYGPRSVAIADLNADGRPDLATADHWTTVSVLLGNGDGTFGARTDFVTGPGASLAIADLNADGRPDLATTVSVLLGNGDGTFGAHTDFVTGYGAQSVAIADLNADGRLDLATANYWTTVSVLLGNGDGTFGARTDFGTGSASFPSSVAIADLNADGRPDLAVSNEGANTVSVLLNRGALPAPLAMAFALTPNTLNLASRGRWVTGHLEPAPPLAAGDIDVSSIRLNGTVPVDPAAPTALGDHDGDGVPDLMVKFDRTAVQLTVPEGDNVRVTVTGTVDGHPFSGTDSIRVRRGRISAPLAGSQLAGGSVAQVRWETPDGVAVESVALVFSPDGGDTWSPIARGQPNTGSYDWMVPSVPTDQAKVAVLVESTEGTGTVEGVLGMSEAFSIGAAVGVGDRGAAEVALAIRGVTPNPAVGGRLRVEFTLRDGSPARLELMDVAGRALTSKQVGLLGPGRHSLDLSEGRALPPGIYFLRLTQGRSEVGTRAAVLP